MKMKIIIIIMDAFYAHTIEIMGKKGIHIKQTNRIKTDIVFVHEMANDRN